MGLSAVQELSEVLVVLVGASLQIRHRWEFMVSTNFDLFYLSLLSPLFFLFPFSLSSESQIAWNRLQRRTAVSPIHLVCLSLCRGNDD